MAQFGRALRSGRRGRRFKSCHFDYLAGAPKTLEIRFSVFFSFIFKNASEFLLRDARHAMHGILLLRISALLPEAISGGGLTPTTDTDLLLATYRGGSQMILV